MLPEDQFAKILVGCQEYRLGVIRSAEYVLVGNTGGAFRNRQHRVAEAANRLYNLAVDALIRDKGHPAIFSAG